MVVKAVGKDNNNAEEEEEQQQQQEIKPLIDTRSTTTTVSSYQGIEHEQEQERENGTRQEQQSQDNNNSPSSLSTTIILIDDAIELIGMGIFQRYILLAAGLCFAADSMEVLLLSFLSIILQVEWQLTETQTNIIMSCVFWGEVMGTLILGSLGDIIGRKPIFTITASIITIFGFITSTCNTYIGILICRFFVGLGAGGLTVPFDIFSEFIPQQYRATNLMIIEYFWTMGSLYVPLVAMITTTSTTSTSRQNGNNEDDNSWRVFVLFCAVPCLLSTILSIYVVPRSPRWLLANGYHDEALEVLRNAASTNGKDPNIIFPPNTKLIQDDDDDVKLHIDNDLDNDNGTVMVDNHDALVVVVHEEKKKIEAKKTSTRRTNHHRHHNFMDLLSPQWRWISFMMWIVWAGFGMVYYGTIILVTMVFASTTTTTTNSDNTITDDHDDDGVGSGIDANNNNNNNNDVDTSSNTNTHYSFHYGDILTSSASELIGVTIGIWFINQYGRIMAQMISYMGGGISVLLLCIVAQQQQHKQTTTTIVDNIVDDSNPSSSDSSSSSSRIQQQQQQLCLLILAFLSRMFFMCGSSSTWVHTAEILTTDIRTTGHGVANAIARITGSICPFLVSMKNTTTAEEEEEEEKSSYVNSIGIPLFVISILMSICLYYLPETKGMHMGIR